MRLLSCDYQLRRQASAEYRTQAVYNPFRDLVLQGHLCFRFQDPNLHMTPSSVRELLDRAGIPSDLRATFQLLPYQHRSMLATPFWVRQAISFLTALFSQATILVLDEPLDGCAFQVFGEQAIALLADASRDGKAVVLITHNPKLARATANSYVWVESQRVEQRFPSEAGNRNDRLQEWLEARL